MNGLTDRQGQVLDFIVEYQRKFGFSPSVRDIMAEFHFTSPNAAAWHLGVLRREGKIDWVEGVARSIRVLDSERGIPIIDLEAITCE